MSQLCTRMSLIALTCLFAWRASDFFVQWHCLLAGLQWWDADIVSEPVMVRDGVLAFTDSHCSTADACSTEFLYTVWGLLFSNLLWIRINNDNNNKQTGRLFQPIAAETLGPLNESSVAFFSELGRKIASISGDNREPSFLYQRISITVQRFNSIMLHNSFSSDEEWPLQLFVLLLTLFLTLGIFTLEGKKIIMKQLNTNNVTT